MKKLFHFLVAATGVFALTMAPSCTKDDQDDTSTGTEEGSGGESGGEEEGDEPSSDEFIEFEITHLTAYSLDVDVTKSAKCARYVVTAFMNDAYNEKSFIESAKTSISPDPSYPRQPFNVFTESTLVPERLLLKGTLSSSEESTGMALNRGSSNSAGGTITPNKYQVAIYAEDDEGNYKVYTSDQFELPEPEFGTEPTVKITNVSAASDLTSVTASYEVEGEWAKLIRGYMLPSENTEAGINWEENPEQLTQYLANLAVSDTPLAYQAGAYEEKVKKALEPNTEIYIYAIPVTADGKLGKLCYEKFTSGVPVMDGTGEVSMTFVKEDPHGTLQFNVELSNEATSARMIVVAENVYSTIEGNLDWVFSDSKQNYWWTEVTADELEKASGIVTFLANYEDTNYHVFAVAITPDGKISPVQTFSDVKSDPAPVVATINYSLGKGEASITVISEDTYYTPGDQWAPAIWDVDVTYKIEKGANTETVYLIKCQEVLDTDSDIEKAITNRYSEISDYENLASFEKFGEEQIQQYAPSYDSQWGGTALVLVTVDTDGNYAIADYYVIKGDTSSTTERQ